MKSQTQTHIFGVKMFRNPRTKSGKAEKMIAAATEGYRGLRNGFHTWETEAQARAAAPGKRVVPIPA